jgi:hypothetical protein
MPSHRPTKHLKLCRPARTTAPCGRARPARRVRLPNQAIPFGSALPLRSRQGVALGRDPGVGEGHEGILRAGVPIFPSERPAGVLQPLACQPPTPPYRRGVGTVGTGATARLAPVGTAVGKRLTTVGVVGTPTVGRRLATPLPTACQGSFMFHAKSPLHAIHPEASNSLRYLLKSAVWLF